jgi:hypothetical protein
MSTGVERPERQFDHSPPSSVEVKNEWSRASNTALCIHDGDRDDVTFSFRFAL